MKWPSIELKNSLKGNQEIDNLFSRFLSGLEKFLCDLIDVEMFDNLDLHKLCFTEFVIL